MQKQVSPKVVALTFGILVTLFAAGFYIFAWTGAPASPPNSNAPAPIHTGSEAQAKQGNLTIGTATIKGDGSVSANLNADKVDSLHAADLLAQSGGGAAVACDLICNGSCPAAPTGWTLRSSTGSSGASQTWNTVNGYVAAAAGRCATYNAYGNLDRGVETMCCYFYTP